MICFFFIHPELVEIIFVDTTPFVKSYFTDSEGHTYDWRGIKSRKTYIANLLKVIDWSKLHQDHVINLSKAHFIAKPVLISESRFDPFV